MHTSVCPFILGFTESVLVPGQHMEIWTDGYFSRIVHQKSSPTTTEIKSFDPAVVEIHKDLAQSLCPAGQKELLGRPDFDIGRAEFLFQEGAM
jgi:hypothetical protein